MKSLSLSLSYIRFHEQYLSFLLYNNPFTYIIYLSVLSNISINATPRSSSSVILLLSSSLPLLQQKAFTKLACSSSRIQNVHELCKLEFIIHHYFNVIYFSLWTAIIQATQPSSSPPKQEKKIIERSTKKEEDGINKPEALQEEPKHHKAEREAEKKSTSSSSREPSLIISATNPVPALFTEPVAPTTIFSNIISIIKLND